MLTVPVYDLGDRIRTLELITEQVASPRVLRSV
jgi:hypothetical protein